MAIDIILREQEWFPSPLYTDNSHIFLGKYFRSKELFA
jgi:hypothetical protein